MTARRLGLFFATNFEIIYWHYTNHTQFAAQTELLYKQLPGRVTNPYTITLEHSRNNGANVYFSFCNMQKMTYKCSLQHLIGTEICLCTGILAEFIGWSDAINLLFCCTLYLALYFVLSIPIRYKRASWRQAPTRFGSIRQMTLKPVYTNNPNINHIVNFVVIFVIILRVLAG
jgi:hypothetical protein